MAPSSKETWGSITKLDDKTAVAEMLGVRIGKVFERGDRPAQPDRW